MIVIENTQNIIDIYAEAGRPLDEDTLESLEFVRKQLADEGIESNWCVIDTRCRVCGFEMVTIVPEIADLENLECANCENMAAMEKESEEDEKEYRGY